MKLKVSGDGSPKQVELYDVLPRITETKVVVSVLVDRLILQAKKGDYDEAVQTFADLRPFMEEMKTIIDEVEILREFLMDTKI